MICGNELHVELVELAKCGIEVGGVEVNLVSLGISSFPLLILGRF